MKIMKCNRFVVRGQLAVNFNSASWNLILRAKSSSSVSFKPFNAIPGLTTLPVIGSLHHFLPVIGTVGNQPNFCHLAEKLYKKFGTVVKLEGIFARAPMVILYQPEHYDQVYRAEDVTPLRPGFESLERYRTVLRKSTYDGVYGLTTAQGKQWREFRTKVNPALLKPKLVKLYAPVLDKVASDMIKRLLRIKDNPEYIKWNFDNEIAKWSLESVALVALGTRIGCLRDDLTDDHPSRQLSKCAKDLLELSYKLEFFPSPWKYISTPNYKKLIKTLDKQWEISSMYIDEAKQQILKRDFEVPEEEKSVIEKLLAIDERVAVSMANEMLFAGIDTVAFAIVGLLYHLAINQQVQEKLREEIRSDSNQTKRYLRACIKESLRIWPVIPANLRRTSKEHVVGGYHIPVGIDVIAPNEFLSKLEKNYPRPLEFIPERWLVEKTDPLYYGNAHPMITLPFGFGARSCIGKRIAELEIDTLITKLFDQVKVTWEGPPIKVVTKVTNLFEKPYYFKFESIK